MRQKVAESDHCDEKSRWRANHAGRRGGHLQTAIWHSPTRSADGSQHQKRKRRSEKRGENEAEGRRVRSLRRKEPLAGKQCGLQGGALTDCDMAQPDEVGGRFATPKKKGVQLNERGA